MLRAIIIDDEEIGASSLKQLIEQHSNQLRVVAITTDAEKGIALMQDYKPDILFLDISMPKMDGFEMLQKLQYKDFKLVITTAHEEFAIQAIKTKAFDYLLKPIDIDDLKLCIHNLVSGTHSLEKPTGKTFPNIIELCVKDGIFFIKPNDIVRLEASGSYTIFYLVNNVKHIASKTLKDYGALLDPACFYRCHNSHVVNLNRVVKLVSQDGFFAQMDDGSKAEIAKKNKDLFLEKLKR